MRSRIKLGLAAFVGSAILGLSGAANATLIGDEITINWLVPDSSTIHASDTVMVTGGNEIVCPGAFDICTGMAGNVIFDIGSETIFFSSSIGSFGVDAFNGFEFADLDWIGGPGEIVGFNLVASSSFLTDEDVSFGSDFIRINLRQTSGDQSFTLTLDVRHFDVPEPGSLAIFGFGLLGLGLARRRRKTA